MVRLGVRLSEYHRMVRTRWRDSMATTRRQAHGLAAHCVGGQYLRRRACRAGGDRLRAQQLIRPALDCWEEGVCGWTMCHDRHATRMKEAMLRLKAGEGWRLAGDPRKAEIHLQVAQDLGEGTGDTEVEARATAELGHLYKVMGRTTLSRASFDSARALSIGMVGEEGLDEAAPWRRVVAVDALDGMGSLALEQGDVKRGQALLEDARRVAGADDLLAARALTALAMRTIRDGDHDVAMGQLQEARERAERAEEPLLFGRILNNLGTIHSEAERYDEALEFYQRALRIREGLDYR